MTKCNTCGGTTVSISGGIVKCEYCGRLYSTTNGEMNLADPEWLYSSAVSMSKSQNEETLKSAIETFEALGSYKDSSSLADACRGMIAQSRVEAEERRLAAERQAELERIESEKRAFEEKQKAKVRGIIIAAVSAVAVIAVVIGIISNSNKSSSYNQAMELYSKGQYEEAREIFNDLEDYSDAASYVSTIDSFLAEKESKYEKGIGYYEKGAYSECITSLVDISDYLDSKDYIEKSVEAIYQQATEYYEAGNFEQAKELLGKIPDSSSKKMDAELLLADIEEIIIEQTNVTNYEQAKNYYDNGDYETAQSLFISLEDWSDAQSYVFEIGNIYYERAQDFFSNGSYEECVHVTNYIDDPEEWSNYLSAQELRDNSINSYVETVTKNAEDIYKSDGSTAMSEYLNSAVCSIFEQSNASTIANAINQKYIPIELTSCVLLEDENLGGDATYGVSDIFENTYEYGIKYFDPYNFSYTEMNHVETYEVYYLDKKYVHFSATIVP